jgi:hypothetical protein
VTEQSRRQQAPEGTPESRYDETSPSFVSEAELYEAQQHTLDRSKEYFTSSRRSRTRAESWSAGSSARS